MHPRDKYWSSSCSHSPILPWVVDSSPAVSTISEIVCLDTVLETLHTFWPEEWRNCRTWRTSVGCRRGTDLLAVPLKKENQRRIKQKGRQTLNGLWTQPTKKISWRCFVPLAASASHLPHQDKLSHNHCFLTRRAYTLEVWCMLLAVLFKILESGI